MNTLDGLTLFQKIAIEGEVALAVSTATSDAEILSRLYQIIKKSPKELREFVIDSFKPLLQLPEERINEVVFYAVNSIFPKKLWIERTIADIKLSLKFAAQESLISTSIDKLEARKRVVKSAFYIFLRKLSFTCEDLSKRLCLAVLDDPKLDFVHDICFAVRQELKSRKKVKYSDELFGLVFNVNDMANFSTETQALETFLELEDEAKNKKRKRTKVSKKRESELEEITKEIMDDLTSTTKDKTKMKFVVTKVNAIDPTQSLPIKEFDSAEDAERFIRYVEERYPALKESAALIIEQRRAK